MLVVWPQEPLGRLAELGDDLARRYGWAVEEAVAFVVTGAVPAYERIRVVTDDPGSDSHSMRVVRARVRLDVEPRVRPAEVAERYAAEQRAALQELGASLPKAVDEDAAELARFLAHHRDGSWRDRTSAWNETHAQRAYSSEQAFHRDATRAFMRVFGEPFSPMREKSRKETT